MAKYVFPAIFEEESGMYNVAFPDLPGCYTCGENLPEAMAMAGDVLGGWLSRAEENGLEIPTASDISALYSNDIAFASFVLCDTDEYRRKHSDKAVKKTLTIPSWLNEVAEANSVNFSRVLQDALCVQLGLKK